MLRITRLFYRFSLLKEHQFLKLAEKEFERLMEIAQGYEEKEVDISSGHNLVSVKNKGNTIVVNTQTPNRQLWYSSTISGPQRYNWLEDKWINGQSKELVEVFEEDIKSMLKR